MRHKRALRVNSALTWCHSAFARGLFRFAAVDGSDIDLAGAIAALIHA